MASTYKQDTQRLKDLYSAEMDAPIIRDTSQNNQEKRNSSPLNSLKDLSLDDLQTLYSGATDHDDDKESFKDLAAQSPEVIEGALERYRNLNRKEGSVALRNVLQSVTGNYGDEALARLNSALDSNVTYGDLRKKYDKEREDYTKKYPYRTLGQAFVPPLLGAIATGGALGKTAVGRSLVSMLPKRAGLRYPLVGGLSAGLYGSGDIEYNEESDTRDAILNRMVSGVADAPFGALLGGGLYGGAKLAKKGATTLPGLKKKIQEADMVQYFRNREQDVPDSLDEAIVSLDSPGNAAALNKLDYKPTPAGMSDMLTEDVAALSDNLLDTKFLNEATKALDDINVSGTGSISKALDEIVDQDIKVPEKNSDEITQAYNVARDESKPIGDKTIIGTFFEDSRLGEMLRQGVRSRRKSISDDPLSVRSRQDELKELETLDDLVQEWEAGIIDTKDIIERLSKEGLSLRVIDAAKRGFDSSFRRRYSLDKKIKGELDTADQNIDYKGFKTWLHKIDDLAPDYKKARRVMSDQMDNQEPYNVGTGFFRPYKSDPVDFREGNVDIFAKNFENLDAKKKYIASLTDEQFEFYRSGALAVLKQKIKKARKLDPSKPRAQKKNPNEAVLKEFDVTNDKELLEELKILFPGNKGKEAELLLRAIQVESEMIKRLQNLHTKKRTATQKKRKRAVQEKTDQLISPNVDLSTFIVSNAIEALSNASLPKATQARLLQLLTSSDSQDIATVVRVLEKAAQSSQFTRLTNLPGRIKSSIALAAGAPGADLFMNVTEGTTPEETSSEKKPKSNYLSSLHKKYPVPQLKKTVLDVIDPIPE
tara:strand:- start:178 stop:2643 length:2466 start_codon:yes stop_codon:yes gene_type:complete